MTLAKAFPLSDSIPTQAGGFQRVTYRSQVGGTRRLQVRELCQDKNSFHRHTELQIDDHVWGMGPHPRLGNFNAMYISRGALQQLVDITRSKNVASSRHVA